MQFFKNRVENANTLEFDTEGLLTSVANGLRRVILTDIPNVGFVQESPNTIVNKNTTALHDEFLAHRMSLLPLIRSAFHGDIPLDKYTFRLKVSQKTHASLITTDDIFVTTENVEGDDIPLDVKRFFVRNEESGNPSIITRFPRYDESTEGEEIDIICKCLKGTQHEFAGFSPVSVCSMYETGQDTHHFLVESIGGISPTEIVYDGLQCVIEKCEHVIQNVKDMKEFCHKTKGVDYKAIDLELAQEGHTMGNMITEWIYSKAPSDLLHISYHEPHPLKSTIILRVGIDTKTDDEDVYIEQVKDFVIGHIKTLQEHLTELGKSWRVQQK